MLACRRSHDQPSLEGTRLPPQFGSIFTNGLYVTLDGRVSRNLAPTACTSGNNADAVAPKCAQSALGSLATLRGRSDMELGSLVLHALRLKGLADADAIARWSGIGISEIQDLLSVAASRQLIMTPRPRGSEWRLTVAGRRAHSEAMGAEGASTVFQQPLAEVYKRFLLLNSELLEVCTSWQLRDGSRNDHLDRAYDAGCVARLQGIDGAVKPICAELSAMLQRYSRYGYRLGLARHRVERGEFDSFTSPRVDSYHSVWFELHEDLLLTLGVPRTEPTRIQ
jgi:hypothetical protein